MRTIESRMEDKEFVEALPKSRIEARAMGAKKYYNGPCKQGHDSYKNASNGECCKCASIYAAKRQKLINPEILAGYIKKATANWHASEKGKIAKQERENSGNANAARVKWINKDPKWAWAIRAGVGARGRKKVKDKNIPFDITNKYIYSILPEKCPVFGTTFAYMVGNGTGIARSDSPSLDRIDPKLGYVVGNIAVISMKANLIKQNASAEEIQKVAEWLKLQENKT